MTYDRMVFGMHHLNITQIGSKYDGKEHLSHAEFEIDCAGEDNGIDYYFNKLPNTHFKCTGRFGTRSTGNTFFFVTCDASGNAKKVLCADSNYRVITLAMTHSNRDAVIGKVYGYNQILVSEGTQGHAFGNHIHIECCEGLVVRKVMNSKGYWNLPNMMDVQKVFWILDGWTTVVDTKGLTFQHCAKAEVVNDVVMEKGKLYFVADRLPCRIRKTLDFKSGKPVGKILTTMPVGAFAEITHLTNRHEKDAQGYEWMQVTYQTPTGDKVSGYVQGDLSAYLIKKGG